MTRDELIEIDGRYSAIPPRTLEAIDCHVSERSEAGSFVNAVLKNDLSGALTAADDQNLAALQIIVRYCHNHIPAGCWGSPEKVAAWRGQMCTSEQKPNGGDEMR